MQDRAEVEAMVLAGVSFGQIEDRIDEMPVSGEAKSVLWLLAWSERDPERRHRSDGEVPTATLPAG
jgi:hypothetical protein